MTLNRVLFSSMSGDWKTPDELYEKLDSEFGFTMDAAPYQFKDFDDGRPWSGRVYVNPPYGSGVGAWIHRGYASAKRGDAEVVVFLLPARTDTAWFHDYVLPHATQIRFLRRRLKFSGAKWDAPFPSMLVVFGALRQKEELR